MLALTKCEPAVVAEGVRDESGDAELESESDACDETLLLAEAHPDALCDGVPRDDADAQADAVSEDVPGGDSELLAVASGEALVLAV